MYVAGFVSENDYVFLRVTFAVTEWPASHTVYLTAGAQMMMSDVLPNDESGNAIYTMASEWENLSWEHQQLCATRLLQRIRRSNSAVRPMFENFCAYRHLEMFGVNDADDEIDRSPLELHLPAQPHYHPPSQRRSLLETLGLSILGYWIARRLFR